MPSINRRHPQQALYCQNVSPQSALDLTRPGRFFFVSTTNSKCSPTLFPFLAAAAVAIVYATTFSLLGAMTVLIAVLVLALQAMSVAFFAAVITAIALCIRGRRGHLA